MKDIQLVVLLALFAVPPVPRRATTYPQGGTARSGAGTTNSNRRKADNPKIAAVPQTPVAGNPEPRSQPDADPKQTVITSEFKTVPKGGKDGWDKIYVISSVGLLFVGAVGVVCAIVTLWTIRRQADIMADQRQVMFAQLRSMQDQITVMSEQTEVGKVSAAAARESIILTHRPKIIVRDVVTAWKALMGRNTTVDNLNANNFDDWQLGGAFYIVNVGNQLAKVISLEQFISFSEMLPLERPYESGVNRRSVNMALSPGQSKRIPFQPVAIGVIRNYSDSRNLNDSNWPNHLRR